LEILRLPEHQIRWREYLGAITEILNPKLFRQLINDQANFNIRKGKSKRAPIILKTKSSVNPMILKGRRISQINGKSIIISRAIGQHNTKSMAHNTTPRKSRI
jgi:hypothetical protein